MRTSTMALLLSAALAGAALAEPLAPGATMPALTLADQHDQAGSIDRDTRLVLFTSDMDASDHAKEALADEGAARLAAAHAVWVANISRMPGIITRLFALPSLRKRPYRMLLDRDGKATADIPATSGKVTLIHLDDLRIERIDYADSAAGVNAALRAAAAGEAQAGESAGEP